MAECPELSKILEESDRDLTADEEDALWTHIEHCAVCRAHLQRLRWIGSSVREAGRSTLDPDEHPTELQLAEFAEHGPRAAGGSGIIDHLSRCRRCREAVIAARSIVSD